LLSRDKISNLADKILKRVSGGLGLISGRRELFGLPNLLQGLVQKGPKVTFTGRRLLRRSRNAPRLVSFALLGDQVSE
jgi:hypothetical protein